VDDYVKQIMAQRSEILDAFVAKFGCQPEEAQQINYGNRWKVEKIDPAEREKLRAEVIKSAAAKEMVDLIRVMLNGMQGFTDREGWFFDNEGDLALKKLREMFALDEPSKIVTL
jgi:hypothetical protein